MNNSTNETKKEKVKNFFKHPATITTGVAVGVIGAGLGIGFLAGSFTTVDQNTVTGYRNITTGELVFTDEAGTKVMNPMLKKIGAMKLTQQEHQFGNEDPKAGIEGYLPFNDAANLEFNASVNVKWSVQDRGNDAVQDAKALYATTGDLDINAGIIVSTIKQAAIKSMQEFVLGKTTGGVPINSQKILSSKGDMSSQLKQDIQAALDAKYKTASHGFINVDSATIGDIVAPPKIAESIAQAAAAAIKASNAKTVADNEAQAAVQEQLARKAEQAVKEQEALNTIISDPLIKAALLSAGIDTSSLSTTGALVAEIQKYNTAHAGKELDLASLIRTSMYYKTWNGVLPSTIAGSGTTLSMLIPKN